MAGMKKRQRARVTTDAAPRAPTYEELEAEVKRLRQRVQELELRPGVVEPPQPGVTLTKEELQGERRRKLFLTSDIYREHIAPKLGKTWRAILLEACGQAVSRPLPRGESKTMSRRDALSSVPMLIWCIERGYPLTADSTATAAEQGNLDVLQYLHENGCPWNESTCAWAARGGHLDVLKYLHDNGCPWDEDTCFMAAEGGHLHVLKYAHEKGCPWNEGTCIAAAKGGHLNVLKYAHENGCPWDEWFDDYYGTGSHISACEWAAKGGHLNVLKYARENGCPWNRAVCRQQASTNGHHHVIAWIDEQPE